MKKAYENPAVYVKRFDVPDEMTSDSTIGLSDITEEVGPWDE